MSLPLRDIVMLILGQSNATNYATSIYKPAGFIELTGAGAAGQTGEQNCIGAAMVQMSDLYGRGGAWAKHASGGQPLEEFAPGGSQYASVQAAETLLRNEYGKIDFLFILGGETNAGNGDSAATVEGYLNDIVGGLVETPTAVLACSPINMAGVSDVNEAAVRQGFVDWAADNSYAHHVSLATVNDDDDLSPNHMVRDSTIEAARNLIVPVWNGLYS